MRRTIPVMVATLLAMGTLPLLAAEDDQRVELPEAGLAVAFPADWTVRTPSGTRESEIRNADGSPVYVTTALMARAEDGRWCDVDIYLDIPATLEEHTYAYARYLQQVHGPERAMLVTETELPAGPAFRIDSFDPGLGRQWAMYLFDGPAEEGQAVDRYLLTCVADGDAAPYWEAIVASIELSPIVEPEGSGMPEATASAAPASGDPAAAATAAPATDEPAA